MANPTVTFRSNWVLVSGSMSDFSLGVGSVTANAGNGLGLVETSGNWAVIKKVIVTTNRPLGYCGYYNGSSYNRVMPTTVQDGDNYISTLIYSSLPSNTQFLYIETSPMGGTYSNLRVYDSNDNIINMATPTKTSSIKLGDTPINKIMLGNTEIKKLYLGDTLVYNNSGT